jgi:hypothetical protein
MHIQIKGIKKGQPLVNEKARHDLRNFLLRFWNSGVGNQTKTKQMRKLHSFLYMETPSRTARLLFHESESIPVIVCANWP